MPDHNCFDCGHPVSRHSGPSPTTGCALCDCERWFMVHPASDPVPIAEPSNAALEAGGRAGLEYVLNAPGSKFGSAESMRHILRAVQPIIEAETLDRLAARLSSDSALEAAADAHERRCAELHVPTHRESAEVIRRSLLQEVRQGGDGAL